MGTTKKIAYIKGLAEGLGVNDSTNEGKIIALLIETLEEMADAIDDLEFAMDDTMDEVASLTEDVEMIAEDFYDDEFDECCYDECGCGCGHDHDDSNIYELACPTCSEKIYMDDEMLDEGSIECPACGKEIEFDLDDEEDESEEEIDED